MATVRSRSAPLRSSIEGAVLPQGPGDGGPRPSPCDHARRSRDRRTQPWCRRRGPRRDPHARCGVGAPRGRRDRQGRRDAATDGRARHDAVPRRPGATGAAARRAHGRSRRLGQGGRARGRRVLHRTDGPGRPRRDHAISAGPVPSSSPSSSTADTASCRCAPTTSARTCRRAAREDVEGALRGSWTAPMEWRSMRAENVRHLLSIVDLGRDEIARCSRPPKASKRSANARSRRCRRCAAGRSSTSSTRTSTRTRVSFEIAAKRLSADVVNVSAAASSVAKGESLRDTARTLRALGADAIVLRHPAAGAPALLARQTDACVMNAGDGAHEHPTQASARHVHRAAALRADRGPAGRRSSATSRTRASRGPGALGFTRMGADVVARRAADACSRSGSTRSGANVLRPRCRARRPRRGLPAAPAARATPGGEFLPTDREFWERLRPDARTPRADEVPKPSSCTPVR